MLRQVTLPVAEIAGMKPTHVTVLIGLLSFADRAGKCWPSLRRLADVIGKKLTTVHTAIGEMEAAGHLTRRRRAGNSTVYQIAKRFLPVFRKRNTESQAASPRSADNGDRSRSTGGTEGVAKKEEQLESKREEGSVRRNAPPPHRRPSHQPASDRLTSGPNPHARKVWLRKLHMFISERLTGDARWRAWELITAAQAGTLDRTQQRQLDWIDKQMRVCGYKPTVLPSY